MKNKYTVLTFLIIFIALLLRLRGFDSHYLISSDTARDLLVARGAIAVGEMPSVGSFSSSGPFVFAPNWYWFLMIPTFLAPNVFMAPWILLLLISLLSVLIMIKTGQLIAGKKLGLITGLITAVSPIGAGYSTYLTQHGLVDFFSCLAVLGFIGYIKTKKLSFAILMAFALGCGMSLHYQMINLLVLFPILVLTNLRQIIPLGIMMGAAFIFPLIPLIWWDSQRGFQNTLHLVGYFRVGQYQIYVPNRWLTYVGVFWTAFLGRIFGGSAIMGALLGVLITVVALVKIATRKIPKAILLSLAAFAVQFIVFRYFRGERYDGYVVYFHGLLFLLVGWTFYEICKMNRFFGFALTAIFIFLSIKSLIPLQDLSNNADKLFETVSRINNGKHSVFARNLSTSNCAFAFSLALDTQSKNDDLGSPLGICKSGANSCQIQGEKFVTVLPFQGDRCVIVDLAKVDKELLTKGNDWYNFSKVAVFDDVQNWWKKESK